MARFIGTVVAAIVLIAAAGLAFIYSGFYDIAADQPHWAATAWFIDQARERSIDEHAEGITAPPGFDDRAKIVEGAEHFSHNCAACHGAPGVRPAEFARGLYPQPADLNVFAASESPGELFWAIKHEIKLSGMPAWSEQSDDAIWAMVAFIQKLPRMKPKDYQALMAANQPQVQQQQPQVQQQQREAEPGVGSQQQQPAPPRSEPRPVPRHRR